MESGAGDNLGCQHNEASLLNRYGGLVHKKPLISTDRKRAYFDSADWALGKQGSDADQKKKANAELLRPKLQRTPHHQLPPRRPSCTSFGDSKVSF